MRLDVLQFVFMVTALSAAVALCFQEEHDRLVWQDRVLRYRAPKIPSNYQRQLKVGFTPLMPEILFLEGRDLFRELHHAGWRAHRYHFYSGFDLAKQPYFCIRPVSSVDLSQDSTSVAATIAYANGYLQCQKEISRLLCNQSEHELRRRLAVRKPQQSVPLTILFLFGLFSFCVATIPVRPGNETFFAISNERPFRLLRRKRWF